MIQYNPGNLLKFSRYAEFQGHKQPGQDRVPYGLRCPNTRLMPFQLYRSIGATTVTWRLVDPVDPTGGIALAMTAGDLTLTDKDGGGTWITWDGQSDLTTVPDCGFWYVELDVDGTKFYSEVLHAFTTADEPTPVYRIRFGNDLDKGDVLYHFLNYQHFLYTKTWAWDRPAIVRELQATEDGSGNETTRFSRTVARFRLEVADLPDSVIPFLAKCGDLDLVQFEDMAASFAVPMVNTAFETRQQGLSRNIGIFTFDAEIESFNGCQENYVLA